ncbi:MAG: hypothetical protein PUF80_00615 [Firmicutes bacterium]|nr:hypothetical protein [Bacillota bacterium]
MKKLSTAFQWVGWLVLAAAVICGIVFSLNAEDGAWLIFLYWAIGGGLFFMFALAQSYVLGVAARADEKMHKEELEEIKQAKSRAAQPRQVAANTPTVKPVATAPVKPIAHDGYISCPICGSNQQPATTHCFGCGAKFIVTQSPTIPQEGYIVCPKCGRDQTSSLASGERRTTCYACGSSLPMKSESTNQKGDS